MARLTDTDVKRLVGALRGETQPAASPATGPPRVDAPIAADRLETPLPEIARVSAAVTAALEAGTLADAIGRALGSYLGREIACAALPDAPRPTDALRFETEGAIALHVDLDAALAAALVDVAIGGDGTNTKHGKRGRIGRALEGGMLEMLRVIAAASGLPAPTEARFIEVARRQATPVAGGSLVLGELRGAWTASAAQREARAISAPQPRARPADVPRPTPPPEPVVAPREVVHAAPEPGLKSPEVRQRVLAARAIDETDSGFGAAVEGARARLAEMLHCATALEAMRVARVDTPVLQRGDLKLALIAGGHGSLVLSADRETVANVAATALHAEDEEAGEPGAVALDAVEAVLRAAMRGFAEKLPTIAGSPGRFVRLAEGALPARSPHFAIVAPVRIGERAATLQWLVPAWMADAHAEPRPILDVP